MRYVLSSLAAVALSACSAGAEPPKPTLEGKVVELARIMNLMTPMSQGEFTLESVRADGRTLVLNVKGIDDWRPHVSDEEAGKLLGAEICDGPGAQALVAEGARFRIDVTTPQGQKLAPLPICLA